MPEEENEKGEVVVVVGRDGSASPRSCCLPSFDCPSFMQHLLALLAIPPVQSLISNLIHILCLPVLSPTCIVGYQYLENKKLVSFYQSHLLYLMCDDESKK